MADNALDKEIRNSKTSSMPGSEYLQVQNFKNVQKFKKKNAFQITRPNYTTCYLDLILHLTVLVFLGRSMFCCLTLIGRAFASRMAQANSASYPQRDGK